MVAPEFRQADLTERRWTETAISLQRSDLEKLVSELDNEVNDKADAEPLVFKERQTSGTETTESSLRSEEPLVLDHPRLEEQARLREWYHRQSKENGSFPLLLVTGQNGSGRVRLVESALEEEQLCLIKGTFDFLKRPQPYAAFASAVEKFTLKLQAHSECQEKVRKTLLKSLGGFRNASALIEIFPSLRYLLSETMDADDAGANKVPESGEFVQRFLFVFRKFMHTVFTLERPIVLLLQNLHWADPCSLDLLFTMLTDTSQNGLVVIATCSDRIEGSVLAYKIREVQSRSNIEIPRIDLGLLSDVDVEEMLCKALALNSSEECKVLTRVVCQQTKGNLLYISEFVQQLRRSESLLFDIDRWIYDEVEVQQAIVTCSLEKFLEQKVLNLLSPGCREVLQVAACLGLTIDEKLVEYVLGRSVSRSLKNALTAGILVLDYGKYTFAHGSVQEAVYGLVAEQERELFHLEVGRRLWRKLNGDELDQHIFLLLTHLNIGKRLISRDKERTAVANLCLYAGQKASASSAFRIAAHHLEFGVELLGERGWRENYDLTLSLCNAGAEMELLSMNYDAMDVIVDFVLQNARSELDKVQAYATRLYMLGSSDQQNDAVDLGIMVLRSLGEKFPARLCKAYLRKEMNSVQKLLKNKTDRQLVELPIMEDKNKLACTRILHVMYLHCLSARTGFAPFVALKSLKLALQYGLSAMASTSFAVYGMLCISQKGDFESGGRYGKLSLRLLEKFHSVEYLPRVNTIYYGGIHPWFHRVGECLSPILKGHRVGLYTGDFEFSAVCAKIYCIYALTSGVKLDEIYGEWKSFRDTMVSTGQHFVLKMTLPFIQVLHHFMGLSSDPSASKGDVIDYDEMLAESERRGLAPRAVTLHLNRLMVAYMFGDILLAKDMSEKIRKLDSALPFKIPPMLDMVIGFYFMALTCLALAERGDSRRKHLMIARSIARRFKQWANQSPYNFLDKQFLVEAELHSVCGKQNKATRKFICAIALARDSGFIFHEGIANERAARHWQRYGDMAAAEPYFRSACACYESWGGIGKQRQLLKEVESLYK